MGDECAMHTGSSNFQQALIHPDINRDKIAFEGVDKNLTHAQPHLV